MKIRLMRDFYIIFPQFKFAIKNHHNYEKSKRVSDGFVYRSNTNEQWLTRKQLENIINKLDLY